MAGIKIGALSIDKAYIGSDEVQKMYLGETEVWSASSPSSGYSGTITNSGYMAADVYIDRIPDGQADYTLISESQTLSCESYVIIGEDVYHEGSIISAPVNCTYEQYIKGDFEGWKVTPTDQDWAFDAQFND